MDRRGVNESMGVKTNKTKFPGIAHMSQDDTITIARLAMQKEQRAQRAREKTCRAGPLGPGLGRHRLA